MINNNYNKLYKGVLQDLSEFSYESKTISSSLEKIWGDNLLLLQGKFTSKKSVYSKIRKRNKSFYRLSWSARQEILAAIDDAYLKDEKTVSINPKSDTPFSALQAATLDFMFDSYTNYLRRRSSLLIQHKKSAANCLDYGFTVGRFLIRDTVYTERPDNITYKVFAPEEIYLDWRCGNESTNMQFCIFEHYLSYNQLNMVAKEFNFIPEVLNDMSPTGYPNSYLRDVRNDGIFLYDYAAKTVPVKTYGVGNIYVVWECYFYLDGVSCKCFTDQYANNILSVPIPLKIKGFPVTIGQVMLVPDRLVGDSIAAITRDAAETYNELMNCRQDNLHLVLNPPRLINRSLRINKELLARAGAGDLVEYDGQQIEQGIMTLNTSDVTSGAFQEAQLAANLIKGLSGLPDYLTGTSGTPEGVISQIYGAAARKLDLIISTYAHTYWKPTAELLLDIITKYAPAESIRIAMLSISKVKGIPIENVYPEQITMFVDENCTVNIAHAARGVQEEIETLLNFTTQAANVNQQNLQLIQSGFKRKEDTSLFDVGKLLSFAMDRAGVRGVGSYMFPLESTPPASSPTEQMGSGVPGMEGALQLPGMEGMGQQPQPSMADLPPDMLAALSSAPVPPPPPPNSGMPNQEGGPPDINMSTGPMPSPVEIAPTEEQEEKIEDTTMPGIKRTIKKKKKNMPIADSSPLMNSGITLPENPLGEPSDGGDQNAI